MAVTKIHAIKKTVSKAISYISDPSKTDGQCLVSAYNCSLMGTHLDFEMTENMAREVKGNYAKTGGGNNKAYHMIQSFAIDDNITPEKAHEIGRKLADELLDGKHEYIIATHIDKNHIHNHIIFNALSFYDYKKFRSQPYKTAFKIRSISDRICSEYDLSVIKSKGKLGYSYKEYSERKKDTSWKSEIRKRLNYLLGTETSYDIFKTKAAALGVEVNDQGKHIKYKYEGQQRYSRGNKLSDTGTYELDGIKERLNRNQIAKEIIIKAVEDEISRVSTYEEFIKSLEERQKISVRTDKKGATIYTIDDQDSTSLSEITLGSKYSMDSIKNRIRSKEDRRYDELKDVDSVEAFQKETQSKVMMTEDKIVIKEKYIDKITLDGILIRLPERNQKKSQRLFIANSNIDYNPKENNYAMTLGSDFDYYYVNDNLDPDILESEQLSGGYIKGEEIIRTLELDSGSEGVNIELEEKDILSLRRNNGISIQLPEIGIARLFIKKEFVDMDKLTGKCTIKLFDNWTYSYREQTEEKKGTVIKKIQGDRLIKYLKERKEEKKQTLERRLMYVERKGNIEDIKELASALVTLRENHLDSIEDLDKKIAETKEKIKEIKATIKNIEDKNKQYKNVIRYLNAYKKNLPIVIEYQKKGLLSKKNFYGIHESEIRVFEHAEKRLVSLGVNTTVEAGKVNEMIQGLEQQKKELGERLGSRENEISHLIDVKHNIEKLNEKGINRRIDLEK